MRLLFLPLMLICCLGCTNVQLTNKTLHHAESAEDVRYKEVLENLAMVADNPANLPSYSSIYAGVTDLTDSFGITNDNFLTNNRPKAQLTSYSGDIDVLASRVIKQNWNLDPVVIPEKLRAMQSACKWALFGPDSISPENRSMLMKYNPTYPRGYYLAVDADLFQLPQCWLHKGSKRDVPRNARYQASCNDTCVWVMPEGIGGLSQFTLIMQDIARLYVDAFYYPRPQTITVKIPNIPDSIKIAGKTVSGHTTATILVDSEGNPTPLKIHNDNVGLDGHLKAQINAAKSP